MATLFETQHGEEILNMMKDAHLSNADLGRKLRKFYMKHKDTLEEKYEVKGIPNHKRRAIRFNNGSSIIMDHTKLEDLGLGKDPLDW